MALKRIKITEAQAFDLLLEAASLGDVYQKYYNQIPEEEFRKIVSADPTSGEDKMGKYSKWLLALYTGGNLKLEDLYKATQYLTIFHKYKQKLQRKDIGQYKSLPDLYREIKPYEDNKQAASHNEEIKQMKEGAEKVYEDATWLIVVPHTKEAAIFYGKGTQWCTAATESENYFDYYNEQGPLYININKKTGRKYQFHFPSQQFMDENDCQLEDDNFPLAELIGLSKGAVDYYRSAVGNDVIYMMFYGGIWKVYNSQDLYVTHAGTTLQRMVNSFPQEIGYCVHGEFSPCLYLNRYIFTKKYDGSEDIKNVFDVKDEEFVFDDSMIRYIRVLERVYFRYISIIEAYSGKQRIYDLKTRDYIDSCGSLTIEDSVYPIRKRYLCGCYSTDLAVISKEVPMEDWYRYDNDNHLTGTFAFVDLSRDKMLTDFYVYKTRCAMYFNGKEFCFMALMNEKKLNSDAVVLFYDGTVVRYGDFAATSDRYFEKYLSEKNMTVEELYLQAHHKY